MPCTFTRLKLPGIILVTPSVFADARGAFVETYKRSEFQRGGIPEEFVQDNESASAGGVLRGLHYQKNPMAQGKLVRCTRGKIFDVAVDVRRSSPTFRKWLGQELSDENHLILYVPPGFAHGFVALSPEAQVSYKCTNEYSQELDRGIRWDDPTIGVEWPGKEFIISGKDRGLPYLDEADTGF